ncbi:MAG: InlB B-repeat-containing protein [Clostridiales bacterium]|jgi:uncharacterized repeat protein (TIGR02543 family)|nr:InlB B-repeat-containing protein [Clostridiales bacterium]
MRKIITHKLIAIVIALLLGIGFVATTPIVQLGASAFAYNNSQSQSTTRTLRDLPDPNAPDAESVIGLHRNQSLTLGRSVPATTKVYNSPDGSNYNINGNNVTNTHPFGKNFAVISLDTINEGGDMERVDTASNTTINSSQAFGFVAGDKLSYNGNIVEVKLHYNYNRLDNINGWSVSDDTHKGTVNGFESMGPVKYGALILEKSKDGIVWNTTNPFPDEDGNFNPANLYTVDFANQFKPSEYDNNTYTVQRLVNKQDSNGDSTEEKEYQDTTTNNKLTLYVPQGEELVGGVYLRISFAYEIKNGNNYRNIVEQTVFFIANNSGEIAFSNLYVQSYEPPVEEPDCECEHCDGKDGECCKDGSCKDSCNEECGCSCNQETPSVEDQLAMSELLQMAGSIKNGHASNEGFVLNFLGNIVYKVRVSKNGAKYNNAQDGQMFYEPGRYDFEITTPIGFVRKYTLYINQRGIKQNLQTYFAQSDAVGEKDANFGLITESSKRILSTADAIPVYHISQTFWHTQSINDYTMPLVGEIVNESLKEDDPDRVIKVGGYDDNGNIIRNAQQGQLTKAGKYTAIFANNIDYFDGNHSGDVYRFVFQFLVMDIPESDLGPSINEGLLQSQLSINSYGAKYYGVTVQSQGVGKVTFAHSDVNTAFNTAYEYVRSLVVVNQDGTYTLNGIDYPNQYTVLEAVTQVAESIIETRYFDLSNPSSYLTVQEDTDGILKQDLQQDIVVFASTWESANSLKGEPFLNDRVYNYINSDGEIKQGTEPIRFIQVAEFESTSVVLEHELSGIKTRIGYLQPVQSVMDGKRMPSGRYKITETNKYGDTSEYYGIYIRKGENTTRIKATRMLSGITVQHDFSIAHNYNILSANNFVIHSASNELDPYGILKVTHRLNGVQQSLDIYQLDEVEDIILDQEGAYTVQAVDRLGNTLTLTVNIFNASKLYNFTLLDGDTTILKQTITGGQSIILPKLDDSNTTLKFVGWQDEYGNIYKDKYTFNQSRDITLTSLWQHRETSITIYDGKQIATHTVQVGDKVVLPTISRQGLELFGFGYDSNSSTNNKNRASNFVIYRNQITSVPNVPSMRLDAMWKETSNTLQVSANTPTDLPSITKDGFTFVGWLQQHNNTSGTIHNAETTITLDSDTTLYAMWIAGRNNDGTVIPAVGGITKFFGDIGKGIAQFFNGIVNFVSNNPLTTMLSTIVVLLALLCFGYTKKKGGVLGKRLLDNKGLAVKKLVSHRTHTLNANSINNPTILQRPKLATADASSFVLQSNNATILDNSVIALSSNNIQQSTIDSNNSFETNKGFYKEYNNNFISRKPRFTRQQRGLATILLGAVALVMICVLAFNSNWQLSLGIKSSIEIDKYEKQLQQEWQVDKDNQEKQNEKDKYGIDNDEEISGISDEEAFLYSQLYVTLSSAGYEVFPSIAHLTIGDTRGFAYTDYNDLYNDDEQENISIYGVGFVGVENKAILEEEIEEGIFVEPILDEDTQDVFDGFSFVIDKNIEVNTQHYIAFDKYIQYTISDYVLQVNLQENSEENYNLSLGYLHDYDIGRVIYDPDLGKEFNPDAFTLNDIVDYALVQDSYKAFINEQTVNGWSVDTLSTVYISMEAFNDFLANNQQESFLGISPEEIYYIQANIPNSHFYYVDGDGVTQILELPPNPANKATIWERIGAALISIAVIVVAIVIATTVMVTTAGTMSLVGSMLIGAAIGFGVEFFMQVTINGTPLNEVDWAKVAVATIAGALSAIPGMQWWGAGLIMGGSQAAMAWIDGADFAGVLLAFGIGFATGVAIHFATKALSKLTSKIASKVKQKLAIRKEIADWISKNPNSKVEIHHIVEQCQIKRSGFTKLLINGEDNLIPLPKEFHQMISREYSSKVSQLTSGTLRDQLTGQTFDFQTKKGWEVIGRLWKEFLKGSVRTNG